MSQLPIDFRPTSRDHMFGTRAQLGDRKVEILRFDTCNELWQVFRYIKKVRQPNPDGGAKQYTHLVAMEIAVAFLRGNHAT